MISTPATKPVNNKEKASLVVRAFGALEARPTVIMEVCGTHTMAIAKGGIRSMLPPWLRLVSGPGCPVCVTAQGEIDQALALADRGDVTVCTFGDMVRVPGSVRGKTLAGSPRVRVTYSPEEALELARSESGREIVFLGVGFETTVPSVAAVIERAAEEGLDNFSVLVLHKTVPTALDVILSDPENAINAFLLPGHVAAVTGSDYFSDILDRGVSGVVSGFEPLEILESIYAACRLLGGPARVLNNYPSVVTRQGSRAAMATAERVFEPCDARWRGIGTIPSSGLKLRQQFAHFDAATRFDLDPGSNEEPAGCRCGSVLMGKTLPGDCPLFGKACTPAEPVGPCMVSSEGTCAAYYRYGSVYGR